MVGKFGASHRDGMAYTPVKFTVVGDTGEILSSSVGNTDKWGIDCTGFWLNVSSID